MADETSAAMNLDLNLGPLQNWGDASEPSSGSYPNFAFELIGGNGLQPGEGSVVAEGRNTDVAKTRENRNGYLEDEALGKKEDDENNNGVEGSLFDCNICLELANDPVVTCCGHLFCWPCLYRWLHHHSDAKECPVCKGEVTMKTVIPIYGSGCITREHEADSSLNIPLRPQAWQVEGWRQTIQRTASITPMEEMIQHLGSTYELSWESVQNQSRNSSGPRVSPVILNSFLNRILTSRGLRRERTAALPTADVVDLTESNRANHELRESRLLSYLRRRSNSNRAATLPNLPSGLSSDESQAVGRMAEPYFDNNPLERNQEQPPPVDDRDSVSSIAAGIHSESHTVDNAVEIDSTVLLSTSSSRRRNDALRISDVDSGDSRSHRRRRLN